MTERDLRTLHPPAPDDQGEHRLLPVDFADLDALIQFCWEAITLGVFRHGLGRKEGAIQLALREALCNAFRHGNRQDRRAPIFFAWRFVDQELRCTLRDTGDGFDHHHPPDPTAPGNCDGEHGRGLFIIRFLADRVSWQKGGRQLTMVFRGDQHTRKEPGSNTNNGQEPKHHPEQH